MSGPSGGNADHRFPDLLARQGGRRSREALASDGKFPLPLGPLIDIRGSKWGRKTCKRPGARGCKGGSKDCERRGFGRLACGGDEGIAPRAIGILY